MNNPPKAFGASLLIALGVLCSVAPSQAETYTSIRQGVLQATATDPANYRIENEVVVFDLWKHFDLAGIKDIQERADAIYLVTSLQGLVNRDRPRLYLIAALALFDIQIRCSEPGYQKRPVPELDQFWLDEFQRKGYLTSIRHTSDLAEVIQLFRKDFAGLVLWDMQTPATGNAALMAAGCESLLPVSKDLGGGRLRQWLAQRFPDLPVNLNLAGRFDGRTPITLEDGRTFPSTGSAKNDVYRYALEKYLKPGLSNPYYLWYNCDPVMWGQLRSFYDVGNYGHLGDRNELQQNGMFNADYWIAKRAFILDVSPWGDTTPKDEPGQPTGSDLNTWNDVLEVSYKQRGGEFGVAGGFPTWWIKYTDVVGEKHPAVPTEWETMTLLTSYNMVNEGDAAFGIANASFFTHLPQMTPAELKTPPPPEVPYKTDATYLAFCMLDYDGSAWVNQMVPVIYATPGRGKLPLNWCINPVIHLRIPHAFRYLYENRTPLDYFGFAADGVGYIHPLALSDRQGRIKESGVAAYEQFAGAIYQRYAVDYTAFYVSTTFASPWIDMAARLDKGFGFGLPLSQRLVNGVPATYVPTHAVNNPREFETEMRGIYSNSNRDGFSPTFKTLRCILMPPTMINQMVEQMRKEFPNNRVEIVDLRNFYRLLAQKLRQPLASPYRDVTAVAATPDKAEGLIATPSSGAKFEIQDTQGVKAWTVKKQDNGLYFCLNIDDAFVQRNAGKPMEVEVTYLDQGNGYLELHYDSRDPAAPLDGAYKAARPLMELKNTGQWRTVTIRLEDPRLDGRENDETDFRICKKENDQFSILRVQVRPCLAQ